MLTAVKGHAAQHFHAAIASFNTLCRRPIAALMTIIVIAISLTLPTLFWIFTQGMTNATQNWNKSGTISLYLHTSLSSAEQNTLVSKIIHLQGVASAQLKTAAEGIKELQQQEGMDNIMQYLPENPLPAVIEVIPGADMHPEALERLFNILKAFPQVEQAKLDMEWLRRLHAILGFFGKTADALMILLGLSVILIVGNTLRLAIQNSAEEIRVLKLVGAHDAFVIRPFLYSGFWYGLIGGVFVVLFVNIFLLSISLVLQEIASLYHMHAPLKGLSLLEAYFVVFISIFLSWIGAFVSVKRQISFIKPYS